MKTWFARQPCCSRWWAQTGHMTAAGRDSSESFQCPATPAPPVCISTAGISEQLLSGEQRPSHCERKMWVVHRFKKTSVTSDLVWKMLQNDLRVKSVSHTTIRLKPAPTCLNLCCSRRSSAVEFKNNVCSCDFNRCLFVLQVGFGNSHVGSTVLPVWKQDSWTLSWCEVSVERLCFHMLNPPPLTPCVRTLWQTCTCYDYCLQMNSAFLKVTNLPWVILVLHS